MSALVEVKDICKIYNPGENEVRALDHVSLSIETGEFVAIIGQSGSGKSTLMNMLGCLDTPTSGAYYLNGQDVSTLTDDEQSDIRNKEIGFIFPGLQSDQQPDCPGKCGTAPDLPGRAEEGAGTPLRGIPENRRSGPPHGPQAKRDVRRPAAAHGHRPGHCGEAAGDSGR